jgi:hypothetical protein
VVGKLGDLVGRDELERSAIKEGQHTVQGR